MDSVKDLIDLTSRKRQEVINIFRMCLPHFKSQYFPSLHPLIPSLLAALKLSSAAAVWPFACPPLHLPSTLHAQDECDKHSEHPHQMLLAAGHVMLSPRCKHLPENGGDSGEYQLPRSRGIGSGSSFTRGVGAKVQTSERLTQTPLFQMICKEQLGLCGAGLTNK